jgi:hypothetical protein
VDSLLTDQIIHDANDYGDRDTIVLRDLSERHKALCLYKQPEGARWVIYIRLPWLRYRMPLGTYPEMTIEAAREGFLKLDLEVLNKAYHAESEPRCADPKAFLEEQYPANDELVFIEKQALEKLQGSRLFYPCSGADVLTPIRLFAPYIQDFWFVDRGYFRSGHQDTREYGFDRPANRHSPLLERDADYRLLDVRIKGLPDQSRYDDDIDPCVRTEEYKHLPSDRVITINTRRGYGFSAFRNEISSIGVFFYRGDSPGEGGSGNHWLKKEHIWEVFAKLENHGLMVLDGSDGLPYIRKQFGEYSSFWKYRSVRFTSQQEIKELCKPFKDRAGNAFTCVGCAGRRYGNTLAWQIQVP